jgi:riboflavin kinase/FMN adenylyltransferase
MIRRGYGKRPMGRIALHKITADQNTSRERMASYPVSWNQVFPEVCRGGALTIGNFDGVHRGHQTLLAELQRQARNLPGPAVAMTFDPPPSQLLRPGATPAAALTTVAERAELMQQRGAEHVLILTTTLELLQLSAQEFFERVLLAGIGPRTLVPGFNFAFGRGREGTVEKLAAMCRVAGLSCVPVPPSQWQGEPVSSSRIRDALLAGNVALAAELLGRPYRLRGRVVTGQRRGLTLGFPTANLEQVPTVVPGNGVYAVRAHAAGRVWSGAANIGPNPTFLEQQRKLEVHLLDFQGDLYGTELTVEFVERLRDTTKFAGVGELVEQLQHDIAAVRQRLAV